MTEDLENWRPRMEAALTPEQRKKFEERTARLCAPAVRQEVRRIRRGRRTGL
jgi:Spy/CpxP family protein refolding chaperone